MAGIAGRLWGASSSEEDSSASESEEEKVTQAADPSKKRVVWAEESSSEDDQPQRRKVISHTDKRYEQMKECIKQMKNHQKVNDFAQLTTDYESAFKMLDKMKSIIDADGGPPNFFIKAITTLEDYCEACHQEHLENKAKDPKLRLPENKQKAFNTLRAKVRKGNKAYEAETKKCREDPEAFADVVEEAADDDEDSASESSGKRSSSGSSNSSSGSKSSDSDSSSNSDSDSDSSSSGSESDSESEDSKSWKSGTESSDDDDGDEEATREKKMLRWLITPEQEKKRAIAAEKKKTADEGKDKKGKNKSDAKDKTPKSNKKDAADAKGKETKDKEEYTPEELMAKVTEIAQMRGRRAYVRKEYMEKLQKLEEHAVKQGPRAQLYILTSMVSADFDSTGSAFEAMKINMWNEAREKVSRMLPLLVESYEKEVRVKAGEEEPETKAEEDEGGAFTHDRLQELFVAFVEKLDDELYKALQLTLDVYGAEYQVILANSSKFLVLLKRCYKFFEETKQVQPLGLMSLRLIEQLYYKPDVLNEAVFKAISSEVPDEEKEDWIWPKDSKAYMMKLVRNVFTKGKPIRQRVDPTDPNAVVDPGLSTQQRLHRRASLCQGYHLALHDHFQAARDLLQLGNLQEQAMDSDVNTQILYNRLLAQMGLSAFRLGKIQDAHNFLMDVCMHNKARELLAQGLSYSKNMDRTPDQERAEKMRQLPYHMHINLEVLESAHHISAMLLEVPNMAMQSIDPNNKRIISRVLRRQLEHYDKQLFTGPPENAKEAVTVAAKALQCGDWQSAFSSLDDLKIWDHIDPGNDPQAGPEIKERIKVRIQTEALRTYLFAYASFYDAFHLDQLVSMFGLDPKRVHSTLSKMMFKEEITAFWDESSKFVLVQHSEPTTVQRLALSLADKGALAVENNERLVDQKSGGYGFATRDQRQAGPAGRWDQGGAGKGRFGKGAPVQAMDEKGRKGKGRGKLGMSGPPRGNRGWENARAGALRGNTQRGWGDRPVQPARA